MIHWEKLRADPEEKRRFRLENAHTSRVEPLVSGGTLEEVLGHELADDSLRIVVLVTHQAKDSWVHREGHEVGILHSFLKPHQLLDELQVRVRTGSSVFNSLVAFVIRDTFC